MMISFTGFEHPIDMRDSYVLALHIANQSLFARVVSALLSGQGEQASEPYTLWGDDGKELCASNVLLPIANPFDLPWKHRRLLGALYSRLEEALLVDEDLRLEMQELHSEMMSCVNQIGFRFNAEYDFGVEWELRHYLKAFDYGIGFQEANSLLDNLIQFVDLAADVAFDMVLLFVNLKTFLGKNDLAELYERMIFRGIRAILVENQNSVSYNQFERKVVVDQHFIEYEATNWSESTPLPQKRICFNGFGAVTF